MTTVRTVTKVRDRAGNAVEVVTTTEYQPSEVTEGTAAQVSGQPVPVVTVETTEEVIAEVGQARWRCLATSGAHTPIPNTVLTTIALDNPDTFDIGDLHDHTSDNTRMVVPATNTSPIWFFRAQVTVVAGSAAGSYQIGIRRNGTDQIAYVNKPIAANSTIVENIPTVDPDVEAGDYYEVFVLQSTGDDAEAGAAFWAVRL